MAVSKTVLLPEKLNLEQILENHPTQKKLKIDNLKYILGLISELPAYDHRLFTSQKDEVLYVPLNSQILKSKIWDYQQYLRYLVEVGVLECNGVYLPGFTSKGYRFTEAYQVKTVRDTVEHPKLVAVTKSQQQKNQRALALYPYLIQHFDGLEIDLEGSQAYLNQVYEEESRSTDKNLSKGAANRYSAALTNVHKLAERAFHFSVDNNGHRFHSTLTNLNKTLRQFLTYQGERLVAYDLSNSQPYLATVLFNKSFYELKKEAVTITLSSLPEETQALLSKDLRARILEYINSHSMYTSVSTLATPVPRCPLMCGEIDLPSQLKTALEIPISAEEYH